MKDTIELINYNYNKLIPIESFLNRVFPVAFYNKDIDDIVYNRIFKPRKDCIPLKLSLPIDWEGIRYIEDRNWRMQLQGWTMFHPVMNIFDSFEEKSILISYFFDIVEDWLQTHKNDNPNTLTSRMPKSYAWYDMSVGFRALIIAFFINRIHNYKILLSQDQHRSLKKISEMHIKNLFYEKAFSLNNHGLFQIQGLMALLQVTNCNGKDKKYAYAIEKMSKLIFSQFTEEGIHKEQSPHYHFYATKTAENIIKTNWYSSKEIENIVERATKNKCWLLDPLSRPVAIGDSILTKQSDIEYPLLQDLADDIIGDFSKSGYSIVRSSWQTDDEKSHMLFFTGMYHTKSHKHRDCLSFELFNKGVRLLCDSGKYGYRSDKYRNYFLSHRAHNTVEIEGFDIIKIKPYQTALKSILKNNDNSYVLTGGLNYPAIKHNRTLIYKPKNWLLIKDKLDFVKARSFTKWLHIGKDFQLIKASDNYFKFISKDGNTMEIECLNTELKSQIHYGNEDDMQGFISEKDYHFEPSIAIGFTGHTSKKEVITIIKYNNDLSYAKYLDGKKALQLNEESFKKPFLKNIKHFFFKKNLQTIVKGKSTIVTLRDEIPFSFFVDKKDKVEKMLIMLPGATNRAKRTTDFQRHSWSDNFNCHIVSFADPTISETNNLSIGWFQYHKNKNCIEVLATLILDIAKNLSVKTKDIIIFGSSAGGFVALKLAEILPEVETISINPQIYLHNYVQSYYQEMKNYSYPDEDLLSSANKYYSRTVISSNQIQKRTASTTIIQNIEDTRHYKKHLMPYIEQFYDNQITKQNIETWHDINKNQSLSVIIYKDETLKHSPPSKTDTLEILKNLGVDISL